MALNLNISYKKMSNFVSFLLPELYLVIKLRSFDFENHYNNLIFFDKKKMMSDLNMSC